MTKQDAVIAHYRQIFHHLTKKNADGTPMRVRVSGKCQTWKREPERFRLPVKYGLYENGAITETNCHEWTPSGA